MTPHRWLFANLRRYSTSSIRNPLPATFLRGGTSKGIFLKRSDLPDDRAQWDRIFLGIMGSPDREHGRQLNGMGGGVSSLSKICVVGPPSEPRGAPVDAEYTFVQVGIRDSSIDYSGNCGNLSSMIGVFALDEGICGHPVHLEGSTATV
jgi:2-methylaconitate cis-trans-isomerase PrpF